MINDSKIRVFIVEDKMLMIEGLMAILEKDESIEVVGYIQDPLKAEEKILHLRPDVVLMDIEFEGASTDGIKVAAEILEKHPINFLMLTSYDEYALIKDAYKKGIKGYVPKDFSKENLVEGIQKVAQGKLYFDPVISIIFDPTPEPIDPENIEQARKPLSKRELDVALTSSEGLTRKQIAEKLHISLNTVDTHFKNIYSKLNIKNNTALFNWLRERKLI